MGLKITVSLDSFLGSALTDPPASSLPACTDVQSGRRVAAAAATKWLARTHDTFIGLKGPGVSLAVSYILCVRLTSTRWYLGSVVAGL